MMPAVVVINPRARGNGGLAAWQRLRPTCHRSFEVEEVFLDPAGHWRAAIDRLELRGSGVVIAAGGDGTVSAVASACIGKNLVLGALGLGSSNDFHKAPRSPRVGASPVRIDVARATKEIPIRITAETRRGGRCTRFAWVSASVGLVARANAIFSGAGATLTALKRASTTLAIGAAAAKAFATHDAIWMDLETSGAPPGGVIRWRGPTANVSVLRSRHLAGPLRFDVPESFPAPSFGVVVVPDDGPLALVGAAGAMLFGRLGRGSSALHVVADRLRLRADEDVELEVDGEVTVAASVVFERVASDGVWCAR